MSKYPRGREEESAALSALLASKSFSNCPNLIRLLRYICNKYWEGKTEDLKEYNLATEALGRAHDFDPALDPIVRVELHRLRDKLKKYYEANGSQHPVQITFQVGSYIPQFTRRGALPAGGVKTLIRRLPAGVIVASALALLAVLAVAKLWQRWLAPARMAARQSLNATPGAAAATGGGPVRVICGYSQDGYFDSAGNAWGGDRFFSGGSAQTRKRSVIARTRDPVLFGYGRFGDFSYDIPLVQRTYELRLHFVETVYGFGTVEGGGESSRLFDVQLNGEPILRLFDPYMDAGGSFVADDRVFKDVGPAPDGYLHLEFKRYVSEPFLSALEVIPSVRGKLSTIRMVAQDNSFVDGSGRVWAPDHYVVGGRLAARMDHVEGTADPDLYAGERWGAFSYAIPVAEGKYSLTFHFAEAYFGAISGGGGVGNRVFDVYCNGVALLRNFDIFKEAGGPNRALQKTFHGLRANGEGKLLLTFVPIKNYACINALEVVDESD